jgi:predicted small integral membrane protein
MRALARLSSLSFAVAVLTVISAIQMVLVTFGNITDYGTNEQFVQHVFAMDTTFKSEDMMWRAITGHGWVTAAYVLVIIWEALTSLVLLAGCVAWASPRRRAAARKLSALGWLMQLMLFAGGFLAIGGEWFQMWQSSKWNGLESAMRYVLLASIGLILVHLAARGHEDGPLNRSGGAREQAVEK